MARYVAEIKHNLKQEKIYSFNSDFKVETGDLVIVKRSNDKTSFATVLNCYECEGDYTGKVVKVMSKRNNKVNDIVGSLVYEGHISILDSVYEDYIKNINNNKSTTLEQFKRKLVRNIILADKPKSTEFEYTVRFEYGAMHIFVNLNSNEVVKLTNRNKQTSGWKKDIKLYNKLNKKFSID